MVSPAPAAISAGSWSKPAMHRGGAEDPVGGGRVPGPVALAAPDPGGATPGDGATVTKMMKGWKIELLMSLPACDNSTKPTTEASEAEDPVGGGRVPGPVALAAPDPGGATPGDAACDRPDGQRIADGEVEQRHGHEDDEGLEDRVVDELAGLRQFSAR
jgi:hypothetical protein